MSAAPPSEPPVAEYRAALQVWARIFGASALGLHRDLETAGYDTVGAFGLTIGDDSPQTEAKAETEEPAVDTVGYVEQIPAEPPAVDAAEQPAALPVRDRAVGVYPPDLTVPGYHVIEYTPRNGSGRTQAALGWDPALGAWIAFPGGQYDPSVLKQSALAAEYVGALQYGMPSVVPPEDIYSAVVLDPAATGERADGKSPALAAPYGSPPDPWASAVPAGWKVVDRAIVSHNSRSVLVRTYGGAETPMSGIWTFFAPDEADTLARAITDAAKIVRSGTAGPPEPADIYAAAYGMEARITTLSGVGNAIRAAATERDLRTVFYRHFSLLFNASTADQALILAVFLERMLRLTEPQP